MQHKNEKFLTLTNFYHRDIFLLFAAEKIYRFLQKNRTICTKEQAKKRADLAVVAVDGAAER